MAADPPADRQRKQGDGRFKPGRSGNPLGRKPGTKNLSTRAAEQLLDGEAKKLTRKAVELALQGDTVALRLCLERIIPARRERLISVDLKPITSPADAVAASATVLSAAADGSLTLGEAGALMDMIGAHLKLIAAAAGPAADPIDATAPEGGSAPGIDGAIAAFERRMARPVKNLDVILATFSSPRERRDEDQEGRP